MRGLPPPKVTPSQLGQLALHPGCPFLSPRPILAGLDLAMPGEAGGLISARPPGADARPPGTLGLHQSPSSWGWPIHTVPHLQAALSCPALQPGPAENQTKQIRLCLSLTASQSSAGPPPALGSGNLKNGWGEEDGVEETQSPQLGASPVLTPPLLACV